MRGRFRVIVYRGAAHNVHCPKDRIRYSVFPMLNEAEAFESQCA